MLKQYRNTLGGLFRVIDAVIIALTWALSYYLRFYFPLIEVTKGFPGFQKYMALTPLIVLLWVFVFSTTGLHGSAKILSRTNEAKLTLKSHFLALLMLIALTHIFREYEYSRGVLLYFGVIGAVGLLASRSFARHLIRALRKSGFQTKKLVIIGNGPFAETLKAKIRKYPELGVTLVSHLTEFQDSASGESPFKAILKTHKPDQVLIALSRNDASKLDGILNQIKDEAIDIQICPDIHEYAALGCEVEDFDGVPIVNLNDSPLDGFGAVAKRMTDISVSLIALFLLIPVFAIVTLLVKLSSRGPVFFLQDRMGLDGRTFKMIKFRSMKMPDPSQAHVEVWTVGDDRKTALGTFLRKSSLDEIPQFWNVLVGDMSLVGPRPERPVFVDKFKHEIPHYMLRHKVKAGITGWAQVNGWRGNTSLKSRIECDLYYIKNWSYLLDWKIMFLTLFKGFKNQNAY